MIRFEEAEEEIRQAEAELAEAEANGAVSKHILDLGRKVRRLKRELRTARRYYADAAGKQRTRLADDKEYQATRGETIRQLRKKVNA